MVSPNRESTIRTCGKKGIYTLLKHPPVPCFSGFFLWENWGQISLKTIAFLRKN